MAGSMAVVGAGAVGLYFGGRLAAAGEDVRFLVRSDYDGLRRDGLTVESVAGDFHLESPQVFRRARDVGPVDLVVVTWKTTANRHFKEVLTPLMGKGTAVLTLQNGLGNTEHLAGLFGPERIMGGLCFVCINRIEPGLVRHTGGGRITVGELQGKGGARLDEIVRRFQAAGIDCRAVEDLAAAQWMKLVWNVPFNGLGVAGAAGPSVLNAHPATPACCLTTDLLLADSRWGQLVRELMSEVIAAARALGHDMPDAVADERIARTRTMGAYKASTLIDFERGQPLELESLFREPLRQAAAAGVATPRLAELCAVLEGLEHRHHVAG